MMKFFVLVFIAFVIVLFFSSIAFAFPETNAQCTALVPPGRWLQGQCFVPATYGISESKKFIPDLTQLAIVFRSSFILGLYPVMWTFVIARKLFFV